VVVDRNWVSSRQPSDLPAFKREMITLFTTVKQRWHVFDTRQTLRKSTFSRALAPHVRLGCMAT
jgi:DNA-binding transcriptional MocR family regulator